MEIRLLKYFMAIANEESILHASEMLHITQPTLSKQMKEFEEELGVKLFIRGNRKVTLTDKGKVLYERAREILELSEKAERELRESDEMINGTIVIGCAVASSVKILSELVKEFREKYPLVHIDLITGTIYQVKEKMDKGLIDIGLFIRPNEWNDYETILFDVEDEFGILMRKDSKWANNKYIDGKDLKEMVLSIPSTFTSDFYNKMYGKNFEKLNIIATHDMISNAVTFVEEGIYNAITVKAAVENCSNKLCYVPLYPEIKTTSCLAWKKHYNYTYTVQRFIDYIKEKLEKNNKKQL